MEVKQKPSIVWPLTGLGINGAWNLIAIFNGNCLKMIASTPGNIGNWLRMIVSFPGNILWIVRSIFELYYSSYMDRTIHIGAVIQLKYGSYDP